MKTYRFIHRSRAFLIALVTAFAASTPAPAMNKAELVDAIASDAGLSKADAKRALESFVNTTSKALKKGDRIALVGFGSFSVSKRSARTGRNPQTGKEIKISAKKVVKFKAGADLSSKVKIAGGGSDDGTPGDIRFAGEIPPKFAEIAKLSLGERAPDLAHEFLAFLAEQGALCGEIDAFDSASIDGSDGVACDLVVALEDLGVRRAAAADFLNSFVSVMNLSLAAGEVTTLEGFGRFVAEEQADGSVLATFEPQFEFGLSIILGLHDQMLGRMSHELTHVMQQARLIADEVADSKKNPPSPEDGALRLKNLLDSADELLALGDEYGDEPLLSRFDQIRDLVMNAEGDLIAFYEKGNQAAGTRVRKGMQELKKLAQDIRKEVQDIKKRD